MIAHTIGNSRYFLSLYNFYLLALPTSWTARTPLRNFATEKKPVRNVSSEQSRRSVVTG